jgi:adenine-specific DNA-methyltransferase
MELLSETMDLRYLLGILNSRYASVLLSNIRAGDYHIYPEHIRNLPVPKIPLNQQQLIISIVDQIIATKNKDHTKDTSHLESQIDAIIFHLYGLTEEEMIKILLLMPLNESERQQIKAFYKNYEQK